MPSDALPLLGIGVAVPDTIDTERGVVARAPALGWKDLALKSLWEAHFGLPVIVENNARAAALVSARLSGGEPSVLQASTPEEIQNHRIIHQAALERDALALEVFRNVVTLNHRGSGPPAHARARPAPPAHP